LVSFIRVVQFRRNEPVIYSCKLKHDYIDVETVNQSMCNSSKANVESFICEQFDDKTLSGCFSMAQRGKGNYILEDGLLFHVEKLFGQYVENLVVPEGRRNHVLKLAHEMCGGHLAMKKTRDRITISGLTWPTLTASCKTFTSSCHVCQKRARVTCFD